MLCYPSRNTGGESTFQKLQCLSSKMRSFRSFKLGISKHKDAQKQCNQINQSRATYKSQNSHFYLSETKLAQWRTAGRAASCLLTCPHCLYEQGEYFQDIVPQGEHKAREGGTPQDKKCCGEYQTGQYMAKSHFSHNSR